jgi:hypothetical protein
MIIDYFVLWSFAFERIRPGRPFEDSMAGAFVERALHQGQPQDHRLALAGVSAGFV